MAESDFIKTAFHGWATLICHDLATGADVELDLSFDLGDLNVTGLARQLHEKVLFKRRGRRAGKGVANGERLTPQVTLSCYVTNMTSSAKPGTPFELLLFKGAYEDCVSVLGENHRDAIHLKVGWYGEDFGDEQDDGFKFLDCVYDINFGEAMEGNKFSMTFDVLGDIEDLEGNVICSEAA